MTPSVEDAFFCYLIDVYSYSVPDSLKIIDFINKNPGRFFLKKKTVTLPDEGKIVVWYVFYKSEMILIDSLLEFIEDDCLPF